MQIEKRDGTLVLFNRQKIINAINKAFEEVDGMIYETDTSESIAIEIEQLVERSEKIYTVEEIQDLVENFLMKSERSDVARAYIAYRSNRTIARNWRSSLMKNISEKLMAKNIENSNANVDENSFGGRKGEAANILLKQYALDYCMSKRSRENHLKNRIYIHDLDSYALGMHNCDSLPFDDLLANGFNTRQTDVRPANSINTAFQLVAVIFQLQSLQQFGGCSATHLDWTMVPYVRKSFYKHFCDGLKYLYKGYENAVNYVEEERLNSNLSIIDAKYIKPWDEAYEYALEMTTRELKQAVEGLFHNLNTLQSRSGNQLPFTSVNFGTCTLPEGRMVIRAMLEGSIKGVGALHKTPIFPCSIFQMMKGVNREPGDPNYDLYKLALESTSKRLYPNYANVDWSGNAGYDRNDPRTYFSTIN